MPSYKDLLKLMHDGCSPREILERMPMPPSHLKRMLGGKRLRDALRMREELAAALAVHEIAAGVHGVTGRFTELLDSQRPETVRKVCLALLHEGLHKPRRRAKAAGAALTVKPWMLLGAPGRSPADAAGDAGREEKNDQNAAQNR